MAFRVFLFNDLGWYLPSVPYKTGFRNRVNGSGVNETLGFLPSIFSLLSFSKITEAR